MTKVRRDMPLPQWIKRTAIGSGGRDPLEMSRVAQWLADSLLPGIITTTWRVGVLPREAFLGQKLGCVRCAASPRSPPCGERRGPRHGPELGLDGHEHLRVGEHGLRALGDARLSFAVTLPIANNSLSSDAQGAMSGGGGFADSYYQVIVLGWQIKRADIKAIYGFLAPTGRFQAGASDNVGSGYWTHTLSVGQTIWLAKSRATAFSAFEIYEVHSTQEGTGIHPGQTLSVDYSLAHTVPLRTDMSLQLALVGYSQWQTTAKSGPTVTPEQAAARYRVSALGFGFNVMLPARKVSVGARYYAELAGRSTLQGYSVQIAAAIAF